MTPVLAKRLGTDRSFERLYRKHANDVYRYALVVLRNQADAEDVTQTTFLNAYRAIQKGERPRSPQNWLIAIAHNVCRQRFRQSQRRPNEVSYEEELAETIVDEDAITAEDIRRALGHLAFNQRSALVMRELEGRSYQEIAEILGTTVSAVETLIFRARRALREQLEEGITCHEAELAISRQLDGRLSRKEKGTLRAHLRECDECAAFARSQRAQRGAIKAIGAIPLPQSLASLFGGGGAATGGGLAAKAALVGAGAVLASGVGYEGVKQGVIRSARPAAASPAAVQKPRTQHHPAANSVVAREAAAVLAAPVHVVKPQHQKPSRRADVKARGDHGKHLGRNHAVSSRSARPGREKKAAPAWSNGRGHQQRATHPTRPTHPTHPTHPTKPAHTKSTQPTNHGHHNSPPKPPKSHKPSPQHGKKTPQAPSEQGNAQKPLRGKSGK
jgi:RNA polymerase sigma factor (sigma-70 family)